MSAVLPSISPITTMLWKGINTYISERIGSVWLGQPLLDTPLTVTATMEAVALIFLFVLYIAIRLLFTGKTQLERDAMRFQEGMQLVEQKAYPKARAYFAKTVVGESRSVLAWTMLGVSHYHEGDVESAQLCLDKACSIDNLALAFFYKGRIAFDGQDFERALIEFDKAVWFDRKMALAYRYKGLTLQQLQLQDQALLVFRAAVQLGDEISHATLQRLNSQQSLKKGKP